MEPTQELDQEGLDQHYKTFFRGQSSDFRASSIAKFVNRLLGATSGKVLDLGCGSCVVSAHLLRQGFDITSCDTSKAMIDMATQVLADEKLPTNQVHLMDVAACHKNFAGTFDRIINLDVIEHIQDDQLALNQMYDILAPAGKIILSVPAHPELFGPKDEKVGHYRRYDKTMLRERMEEAGFKNIQLRYWNFVGYLSVYISQKILSKGIDESFRSTERSRKQAAINWLLRTWLQSVENHIPVPVGLTLFALAEKHEA